MKRLLKIIGVLCVFCGLLLPLCAADAVEPCSVTVTNFRDQAVDNLSAETYYDGTTLLFTNCVMYAGTTTNSAKQGLDGVTLAMTIGNSTTNVTYTITTGTTGGVWSCSTTVPTFSGYTYVQFKITDASTNVYIYPWRILNRKTPL
jgi:hypothetical protein